jgi:hypothetical protein
MYDKKTKPLRYGEKLKDVSGDKRPPLIQIILRMLFCENDL